jgi:hypothetical protein
MTLQWEFEIIANVYFICMTVIYSMWQMWNSRRITRNLFREQKQHQKPNTNVLEASVKELKAKCIFQNCSLKTSSFIFYSKLR